jgi:hypothetical protein
MEPDRRKLLGPVVIGLGAGQGYSGEDLTSARTAALAGELPYLAADGSARAGDADPVLELRIHGVGGAPPTDNLESPATLQVAGDGTAGFHRAWYPGGSTAGRPRREAYCWGGLNTRATSRAFYLLLVAFMMINVAHWALPGRPAHLGNRIGRSLLRLLGLAVTVAFFTTTVTVFGDLVAWQASARRRRQLPSWMDWYQLRDTGPRLALALIVVLAVLGGIVWLSRTTMKSYERWGVIGYPDPDPEWPLTWPTFWRGERSVNRQRNVHVIAVAALVLFFAALPRSSLDGLRITLLVLAAVLGAVAIVLIASPWTDRLTIAGAPEQWADVVCTWFARSAVVLALAVSVARFWWRPNAHSDALPGDQLMQAAVIFAEFALIAVLTVIVIAQVPWRPGREVMGFGLAGPLLAAAAGVIATVFGSSLTLAVANVIGTPRTTAGQTTPKGNNLFLPSAVYAGGFGMVVAVAALLGAAGYLIWWCRWEGNRLARVDDERPPDSVQSSYPVPGSPGAAQSVGRTWATAELTDRAPIPLTALAVPTALALVTELILLQSGVDWPFAHSVAVIGGTIGVAVTVFFLGLLRSALTNASKRRRFGTLWDVGTFWPRACHPFGPPCYAERTVPEVVDRLRRLVGDRVRDATDAAAAQEDAELRDRQADAPLERHSPVLLTGYSQGTPISVAVVAQLPQDVREEMALLTLAAPIRRLYGRAFPSYFGPDQLAKIENYLGGTDAVRWRNLVRRSDYIGGWAFSPDLRSADSARIDTVIYDPPVLWDDRDPSPPPRHLHSDWFPDPQVRPHAVALALQLETGLRGRGRATGDDRGGEPTPAGQPNPLGRTSAAAEKKDSSE